MASIASTSKYPIVNFRDSQRPFLPDSSSLYASPKWIISYTFTQGLKAQVLLNFRSGMANGNHRLRRVIMMKTMQTMQTMTLCRNVDAQEKHPRSSMYMWVVTIHIRPCGCEPKKKIKSYAHSTMRTASKWWKLSQNSLNVPKTVHFSEVLTFWTCQRSQTEIEYS